MRSFLPYPNCLRIISSLLILFLLHLTDASVVAQRKHSLPDSVYSADTGSNHSASLDTDSGSAISDSVSSVPDTAEAQATPVHVPDTITLRQISSELVKKYQADDDFAYANDPAYWKKEKIQAPQESWLDRLFNSNVFKDILYALIIVAVLFIIIKILVDNRMHLFYRKPKRVQTTREDERVEDIHDEELDEKLSASIRSEDFRMATRYAYLKTLKVLDSRQLIRYHAQGTNEEYILAMKNHVQGNRFRLLSRAYEYVWYGDFAVSKNQFELLMHEFNQLYNIS